MLDINLRIDSAGYSQKPTKDEAAAVNSRLSKTKCKPINFDDFCFLIGSKGHSFCISDFYGKRKKENFKSQQIFALDFDGGADFNNILERAKNYNLPIALAYETLSSVDANKFRIVFITDFVITDIRISEIITDALMTVFYECDKSCCDVSRMFYGGKNILYSKEDTLSLSTLMMEFPRFLKDKYGDTHYQKHIEKFTLKHKLKRRSGFAYISKKESSDFLSFSEDNNDYFFNFEDTKTPTNNKSKRDKIRHFNFDALDKACRLFHEFQSYTGWLDHNELFGIACNMNSIDKGKKKFLEIIEESAIESYQDKDWRYYFNYMTAEEYQPIDCAKFCPYADSCNHAKNMILTAKVNRNNVVKLKEKTYCSLEDAVSELEMKLSAAINSDKNQINIIKAQTAIGKTHLYINMIKNSKKKFIIAVPTNILKDEVYDRLISEGVTGVVKTESISSLEELNNSIGDSVRNFNALGTHRDLIEYIKKEATDGKDYLLEYIKPLEKYGCDDIRVIVTTHKKLLNANEEFLKQYEIIIDEDILISSVKNSTEVLIDDIKKLRNYDKVKKFIADLKTNEEYILTSPCRSYIDFNTMIKKGITSNVNAFMSATAIHISGKFANCFVPPVFPNVKLTILSATASKEVYKMFFKDRIINLEECSKARYKGRLIQDCSRSFSRKDIDNDEAFFENILNENPDAQHIITFMKYKSKAKNCLIHYGNSEGCDYMKGQDIVVIGTPHYNEVVYKLIATSLGADVNFKMRFSELTDDNYKYWLTTYDEPVLREIQLWLIKSELIQAVGRARLLRFDCTVKLYASIPLDQAEILKCS